MTSTKGHAALKQYLDDNEISQVGLARIAKISTMQVSHLVNERRGASLRVAVRIEQATGGAVPADAWTMLKED